MEPRAEIKMPKRENDPEAPLATKPKMTEVLDDVISSDGKYKFVTLKQVQPTIERVSGLMKAWEQSKAQIEELETKLELLKKAGNDHQETWETAVKIDHAYIEYNDTRRLLMDEVKYHFQRNPLSDDNFYRAAGRYRFAIGLLQELAKEECQLLDRAEELRKQGKPAEAAKIEQEFDAAFVERADELVQDYNHLFIRVGRLLRKEQWQEMGFMFPAALETFTTHESMRKEIPVPELPIEDLPEGHPAKKTGDPHSIEQLRVPDHLQDNREFWKMRDRSWSGPLPEGQIRLDAILTHYTVMDRLVKIARLADDKISKIDGDSKYLYDSDREKARREVFDDIFLVFHETKRKLSQEVTTIVSNAVHYGFDNTGPLNETELQVFAYQLELDRRTNAPQADRHFEDIGTFREENSAELPVTSRISTAFSRAYADGSIPVNLPESYWHEQQLSGSDLRAELAALQSRDATAFRRGTFFYESLKREVGHFQKITAALDRVGIGAEYGLAVDFAESESVSSGINSVMEAAYNEIFDSLERDLEASPVEINRIFRNYLEQNAEHPEIEKLRRFVSSFATEYRDILPQDTR